jgi:hypothetical protein
MDKEINNKAKVSVHTLTAMTPNEKGLALTK